MYTNVHSQNNYQANLSNRSYGFKELAVLYFPNIAPASASIRLKQWIKDDVELLGSLEETNYHLSNRILTPKQRDLITTTFGSPFCPRSAAAPTATAHPLRWGNALRQGGRPRPPTKRLPQRGTGGG